MNRRRTAEANWFLLDFDQRERLMHEHGQTGVQFAGKVTQLVTAAEILSHCRVGTWESGEKGAGGRE